MKLDELLPRLLPEVAGCPDVTARQALLDAAIEFCRDSGAWDQVQEQAITLSDGVGSYDIDCDSDGRVLAVKRVWHACGELSPKSTAELSLVLPTWETARSNVPAFYNTADARQALRVYPIPDGAQGLKLSLRAAFVPRLDAQYLDDALVNDWYEALLAGAKARLMAMPRRAWSDPQLAAYHKGAFNDAKTEARIAAAADGAQASSTVRVRRFGF
jgi:hypothetical protein